ncbi:MAG: phosphodiester glycosidase family protein [Anaerorhabdus sp.]
MKREDLQALGLEQAAIEGVMKLHNVDVEANKLEATKIANKHELAFHNTVEVVKQLMEQFSIPLKNVKQHFDWSKKNCPHRIRQEGTWNEFLFLLTKDEDKEEVKLKDGYQKILWDRQTVHIYKGSKELELGMMSATGKVDYQARKTIDKIDDDRVHYCKVNANYFNMSDGQHYGVELTPQIKLAPKQASWLALWQDLKGELHYGLSSNFWLSSNEVKFACSPAAILIHDGKEVNKYSTAVGESKKTRANTQTLLLRLNTGDFALGVVTGHLTPKQCVKLAKTLNASHLSLFDGGGSSQMITEGNKKVFTGRPIANVLTLFKKEDTSNKEPNKDDDSKLSRKMVISKVGVRVRSELKFFNNKASASILKFCPIGSEVEIIDFVDGLQADGYQWAKVKYQGIEGYSQYDSTCYWIKD